jgi:hypothetical protein
LLVVDGVVGLLFRERLEPILRRFLPGLSLTPIAVAEILGGGLSASLLLTWGRI